MDWKESLKPTKKNIVLTLLILGISFYSLNSLKFTYQGMSSFSLFGLVFIIAPAMPAALLLDYLGRDTTYELLANQVLYVPSIILFNYIFSSLIISLYDSFKSKK